MKFLHVAFPIILLAAQSLALGGCVSPGKGSSTAGGKRGHADAFQEAQTLPEKFASRFYNQRSEAWEPAEITLRTSTDPLFYLVASHGRKNYRVKYPMAQLPSLVRGLEGIVQPNSTRPENTGRKQNYRTIYESSGKRVEAGMYSAYFDGLPETVLIVADFDNTADKQEMRLSMEETRRLIEVLRTFGPIEEVEYSIEIKRP